MPEMKTFTVIEARHVEVVANSPAEAAQIANKAFAIGDTQVGRGLRSKEGLHGIWGDTQSKVRQIAIEVKEKGY